MVSNIFMPSVTTIGTGAAFLWNSNILNPLNDSTLSGDSNGSIRSNPFRRAEYYSPAELSSRLTPLSKIAFIVAKTILTGICYAATSALIGRYITPLLALSPTIAALLEFGAGWTLSTLATNYGTDRHIASLCYMKINPIILPS